MTPFWDSILTNKNFNDIKDYENLNLLIKRIDDHIEISFKLTYSVNVFIYEENNYYYLCLNHKLLYDKFDNKKIKRHYNFFDKLILYKDKYEFIDLQHNIYTIPFNCETGINIINNWIDKYRNIINNIDEHKLILELSSGIDTRILTYFWRNNNKQYTLYTKNDPKEIETSKEIINYIKKNFPVKLNVKTEKSKYEINECISLNDGNIDHGFWRAHDPSYFYEVIGNSFKYNKAKHIVKDICPFYDKEYLSLLGNYAGEMKITLFKYLCDEKQLNQLPIITLGYKQIKFNEDIQNFLSLEYYENKIKC